MSHVATKRSWFEWLMITVWFWNSYIVIWHISINSKILIINLCSAVVLVANGGIFLSIISLYFLIAFSSAYLF